MPDDTTNPASIPTPWPIDGVLDLHLFKPAEVGDLVPGYLEECRKRGILQVRIIHGKGTGQLRERVHAILRGDPGVMAFSLAPAEAGGWGATVVNLRDFLIVGWKSKGLMEIRRGNVVN